MKNLTIPAITTFAHTILKPATKVITTAFTLGTGVNLAAQQLISTHWHIIATNLPWLPENIAALLIVLGTFIASIYVCLTSKTFLDALTELHNATNPAEGEEEAGKKTLK